MGRSYGDKLFDSIQENASLSSRIAVIENIVNDLKYKNKVVENQFEDLQKDNKDLHNINTDLQKDNKELKIKNKVVENQIEDLHNINTDLLKDNKDLTYKIEDLQKDNKHLQIGLNKLIIDLEYKKYLVALQDLNSFYQLERTGPFSISAQLKKIEIHNILNN
jgi:chromosome segregation ATPase